jgi:hypothetical protein
MGRDKARVVKRLTFICATGSYSFVVSMNLGVWMLYGCSMPVLGKNLMLYRSYTCFSESYA